MNIKRKSRTTTVLAAMLVLTLTGVLSACGNAAPRNLLESIQSGSVILGTKFDQPGLGLRNPDRSMTGFDVQVSEYVVNQIAESRGWAPPEIRWRETPSAQRETLISNGEVDMIAATYSITATRAAAVSFAGPYLVVRQGLLVRGDDSSIEQLTDLNNGKRLCSVTGSTSAQNVKNQLPGIQLQEFDSYSTCVEALFRNKVDALTTDESILAGFNEQYGDVFRLVDMTYPQEACVNGALRAAGAPFSTERYGIGVALGDDAAVAALNEAITAMIADGSWERAARETMGDAEIDRLIERAGGPAEFAPAVGDLSFLDSSSTPCGGAS